MWGCFGGSEAGALLGLSGGGCGQGDSVIESGDGPKGAAEAPETVFTAERKVETVLPPDLPKGIQNPAVTGVDSISLKGNLAEALGN